MCYLEWRRAKCIDKPVPIISINIKSSYYCAGFNFIKGILLLNLTTYLVVVVGGSNAFI